MEQESRDHHRGNLTSAEQHQHNMWNSALERDLPGSGEYAEGGHRLQNHAHAEDAPSPVEESQNPFSDHQNPFTRHQQGANPIPQFKE